jgi:hypothetical protein
MPIQRICRGYDQCRMGHVSLEHEKDRPYPQAEGRKAKHEGNEMGGIGAIAQKITSHPQLSSVVKEQNNKILLKT